MVLLETSKVRKWFGDTHAVDDVDFVVNRGELLGLIGSNGAGKTTLVNLISGLFRPDAGRIVFDGADVTHQSVHERIREGIARSFQLVNLFDQMTALDNVALTIFAREGKPRRMTALDEPTSGVSTREKAPIMDIVTSIVRTGGITAVVIEHDMDVVFTYSDRIVAMHEGAILADGTPDEIRRNERVTTTLIGT